MILSNFFCLILLLLIPGGAVSISFNFSGFQPNLTEISYRGDALPGAGGVIQLTKNQKDASLTRSVGRVFYSRPVRLWDSKTGKLADFSTHFSFVINALNSTLFGDGLAFFLVPLNYSDIPPNSEGGYLGLFSNSSALIPAKNQVVAVEFDTYNNGWDPSPNHVGINVNSIASVANVTWNTSIRDGRTANVWVSYNSTSMNLSVFLTYVKSPIFNGISSLWHVVDLRQVLPESVSVGFSAATGQLTEVHNLKSWNFSSSLDNSISTDKKKIQGLVIGPSVGIGTALGLILGLGLIWLVMRRKRLLSTVKKVEKVLDHSDEFEKGTAPKRFAFLDLVRATKNFSEEGKLGEGGFGGVYKGFLRDDTSTQVAVKRVSRGSKQGKKEYTSEVRIISRLRHRNLVQLIGWCHERNEFLLVYEFMPNGSLDSHLYGAKPKLNWAAKYKIALGLASALLYLHEEWEQCVLHRDIKSSNVMLDLNYNPKLGDFGLARLVDHELGSQTTVLAGTMGYLAPECVTMGKASKESDVYSFGVVALEIACGRRPVELKQTEAIKVRLVEWVWDLYGKGRVTEAADREVKETATFDEQQLECLLVVGLWCCHPDQGARPCIKQVINVLNFEAPMPTLPSKLPVPMYYAPPMNMCRFSFTSSAGLTDSGPDRARCSTSSCSSSAGSSKALLQLKNHVLDF